MFKNIYYNIYQENSQIHVILFKNYKLIDVKYMSMITLTQICNIQYISLITNLSDVL